MTYLPLSIFVAQRRYLNGLNSNVPDNHFNYLIANYDAACIINTIVTKLTLGPLPEHSGKTQVTKVRLRIWSSQKLNPAISSSAYNTYHRDRRGQEGNRK